MRILAIRGQNLASLAAEFELDLTREPLAGVGFFAITGPTGAGKSTILDALCLALYGTFPRVAGGRQENAPDSSGEALPISDSRSILRRGAGSGFAEVDFVGQDDVHYRARWEVYRARNKANGRLQDANRTLIRIEDRQAIAIKKKQVQEAVDAKTGLTFDQFKRTVLLAQGDFDAFLLASEGERAALLEKVTGTEHYATISKNVHQETERRRTVVQELEQKREALALLDDGVRDAYISNQKAHSQSAGEKAEERKRASDCLEKLNALNTARENLGKAGAGLEEAQRGHDAVAPDRETLRKLEAAEPLRVLKAARDAAKKNLGQCEAAAQDAASALVIAKAKDENVVQGLLQAQKEHAAAGRVAETFAPQWERAVDLDGKIEAASNERAKASLDENNALAAVGTAKAGLGAIETAIRDAASAYDAACAALEKQSASALLAERQEEIAGRLEKRRQAHALHVSENNTATTAKARSQELEKRRDALTLQRLSVQQKHDAHDRDVQQRQVALDALNVPLLEERDTGFGSLLDYARVLAHESGRFRKARENVLRARQEADAAGKDSDAATTRIAEAERELQEARTRLAELEPLHDLAESSASAEAVRLRSVLIEGQPCPVCGSAEHRETSGLDALQRLAAEYRQRRNALRATRETQQSLLTKASAALAKAQARKQEALRAAAAQEAEAAAADKDYTGPRASLQPLLSLVPDAPPLPQAFGEATPEDTVLALKSIVTAAQAARQATTAQIEDARSLQQAIGRGLKEQKDFAAQLARLDAQLSELQLELHQTEMALKAAETRAAGLADALASADGELAPYLSAAGLAAADADRDPDGVAAALKSRAETYNTCKADGRRLDKERQELEPKRAAAVATFEAEATRHGEAVKRLKERDDIAASLRSERSKLLGGENTAAHRTKISAELSKALERLNAMQEARNRAQSEYQAAIARKDEVDRACQAARDENLSAGAVYEARCQAFGETAAVIEALLAICIDERTGLQEKLRALDAKLHAAQSAYLTRRADLERLETNAGEMPDSAALAATIAECDAAIAELNQKIGEIAATLERDRNARDAAAGFATEIEVARHDFQIAQDVDDAIGSPTGDKFRRFVQAITLDQLISLANTHLQALNPRYSLIRSAHSNLSIHIIDRDMADEQRASRSLSGGERFLVSLALALALSGLEGRTSFVDTLFIDEGFGALDTDTLDIAIDALETLHGRGQKVGVITHVATMIDRIPVQVRVEKKGGGQSVVSIADTTAAQWRLPLAS